MPKYTVRTTILDSKATDAKDAEGKTVYEQKTYLPGSSIELEENEAYKMRHALEDAPNKPGDEPGIVKAAKKPRSEGGDDLDDPELDAALESIANRPDNPESGVHLHWQTQAGNAAPPIRQRNLEGGAEIPVDVNANQNLSGPQFARPDSNKTKMELEAEEKVGKKADDKPAATAAKPAANPAPAPATPAKK